MSTEPPGLRTTTSLAGSAASDVDTARVHDERDHGRAPGRDTERLPEPRRREPGGGTRTPPPRRKRKARKVHRVVRHIEVWSVAKLAAIFAACAYLVGMISGYLLWQAADRVGTIEGIEGFIESSAAYESFDILGGVVFRVAAVTGFVLALVSLAVAVLGALLFNLISDLTGGIRMTVIDEDLIVAPARRPGGPPTR